MGPKKKKITDLKFDQRNINKGSEFGNSLLEKSIREVGLGRSILTDKNGNIIAGNQTVQKASDLGFTDIIEVETDGKQLVVVKRTDLDINSPMGIKAKILDNTVSKYNYIEDATVMEVLCQEAEILPADYGLTPPVPSAIEDNFKIPEEIHTNIVVGDLFEIGIHRLLCGDSTSKKEVETLLGGAKPNIMVTDPPYGVNYDADWRNRADLTNGKPYGARAIGKVINDQNADWTKAYKLFPGNISYIWHAAKNARLVSQNIEDCGFIIVNQIIWAKNGMVISRGDYHWQHEPCWYAVRSGKKHDFRGGRSQTTLWNIDRPSKSETGHSTQKPVECMSRPIQNHIGDIYDPFIGSGTTMVAAEQLDRICFGMEIHPGYCQITLDRMSKLRPELLILKNGHPFKPDIL